MDVVTRKKPLTAKTVLEGSSRKISNSDGMEEIDRIRSSSILKKSWITRNKVR